MTENTQHILPSVFLHDRIHSHIINITLQLDSLTAQASATRYLQNTGTIWINLVYIYWEEKTNNVLKKWQSSSTEKWMFSLW